ncbi:MAG: glycoside hydrolase, partial [Candidatus Cryptobacteroides sp.]
STEQKDKALEKALREKVQFLIDDAPSLAMSLNAKAPLRITDLRNGYEHSRSGNAVSLTPLCCAGKNLTRTPVMMVGFGKGKGKVVVSQLITEGRLCGEKDFVDYGIDFYGKRHDEAAVQTVLNLLLAIL